MFNLSVLTQPIAPSRSLHHSLMFVALVVPWMVAAWPAIGASMLAVFLACRSSGRLSFTTFRIGSQDVIPMLLLIGTGIWTLGLHHYATV